MKKSMIVKASLFTLILALMVFGTLTVRAVMKNNDEKAIAEKVVKKRAIVQQWFHVSVSGSESNPANWSVGSMRTAPPSGPSLSECALNNTGSYCAILLEFDDGEVDPEDLQNSTLEEIQDLYDVSVINDARQPI